MSKRDELYEKFGPTLLEAIVRTIIEDLNRIRTTAGMVQITKEMFMDQIENNLSHLEPYNWMEEI